MPNPSTRLAWSLILTYCGILAVERKTVSSLDRERA